MSVYCKVWLSVLDGCAFLQAHADKVISESCILFKGADVIKDSSSKAVKVVHRTLGTILGGEQIGGLFRLSSFLTTSGLTTLRSFLDRAMVCSMIEKSCLPFISK